MTLLARRNGLITLFEQTTTCNGLFHIPQQEQNSSQAKVLSIHGTPYSSAALGVWSIAHGGPDIHPKVQKASND